MRRTSLMLPVLILALLTAACGDGGPDEVTAGGSSTTAPGSTAPDDTTPTSTPPDLQPVDPDVVRFRVDRGGGFVPVDLSVSQIPSLSVMGDLSTIRTGPIPDIYPGPALPNLQRGTIALSDLVGLGTQARDAGLLEPDVDFGQPGVTDLDTTTVTLLVEGEVHTLSAYALDVDFEEQLSAEQQQNRTALRDLIAAADAAVVDSGEAYEAHAVTVYRFPFTEPSVDAEGITAEIVPWPLDDPAAWPATTFDAGCTTYEGDDVTTVLDTAADATQITGFTTAGAGEAQTDANTFKLVFRPLLPDETDRCAT